MFYFSFLARDVRMQGKWLKKQLKKMNSKKEIAALLEETREVEMTDQGQQPAATANKNGELDLKLEENKDDEKNHTVEEKGKHDAKESSPKIDAEEEPIAPAPAPFFIHARHTW
jgi:hypothetical protein